MSSGPDPFRLVGFAVGRPHRHDSAAVPLESFLSPGLSLVLGPRSGHGRFSSPYTSPHLTQPLCAGSAWLYFSVPSAQNGSLFLLLVTSMPQSAGDGRWAGVGGASIPGREG